MCGQGTSSSCCPLNITIHVTDANDFPTILDVNGDQIRGTDFCVNITEGQNPDVPLISDRAFFADQDLTPKVVQVRVSLTHTLPEIAESLIIVGTVPNILSVHGNGSKVITIRATDPSTVALSYFCTE